MNTPVRRAWVLSFAWIVVIALESFVGSSDNTGHLLYPLLKFLFPKITFAHMFQIHYVVRKVGHFTGYAILSLTLYRSWWTTLRVRGGYQALWWSDMFRNWSGYAALLALICTAAVAGGDEFHQSLSPGRTASVADVALDEMGGILSQTAILIASSAGFSTRKRREMKDTQPVARV